MVGWVVVFGAWCFLGGSCLWWLVVLVGSCFGWFGLVVVLGWVVVLRWL